MLSVPQVDDKMRRIGHSLSHYFRNQLRTHPLPRGGTDYLATQLSGGHVNNKLKFIGQQTRKLKRIGHQTDKVKLIGHQADKLLKRIGHCASER